MVLAWVRTTLGRSSSTSAHLLVICLVLGKNLLSHLLLTLMDIRVKLVSVLTDRKLLVIVDGDVDFLRANWLLVRVVELRDVGVLKSLLSGQTLIWVELKEVF